MNDRVSAVTSRPALGRHPLPWSVCFTPQGYAVRDADAAIVARCDDEKALLLWNGIVASVNLSAPVGLEPYSITMQQARCLAHIEQGISENGICPSYQELADAFGFKGKGRVHAIIKGLLERNRIRLIPYCARSIVVLSPLTEQERQACNPSPKH